MPDSTALPSHLRLRYDLRLQSYPDGSLLVHSPAGQQWIVNPVAQVLLRALIHPCTLDAFYLHMADDAPADEIERALTSLYAKGWLRDAAAETPATYWEAFGYTAAPDLLTCSLAVLPPFDAASMAASLREHQLAISEDAPLLLLFTSDYSSDETKHRAWQAREAGQYVLLCRPLFPDPWIGPLLPPGGPLCISCLQHLLAPAPQAGRPRMLVLSQTAIEATACRAVGFISGQNIESGVLHTLDSRLLTLKAHTLYGGCTECCVSHAPAHFVSSLPHVPIRASWHGEAGTRSLTPADTYARCLCNVSPLLGPVLELDTLPLDDAAPFAVCRAIYRRRTIRTPEVVSLDVAWGKGRTLTQARTSALAEALERASACFQGCETIKLASFEELTETALDPTALQHLSERQRAVAPYDGGGLADEVLPAPCDGQTQLAWTLAISERTPTPVLVPTAAVFFGYEGPGTSCFYATSNGVAAAVTREEAFVQAFLELVERDALAIWWYNTITRPAVDLTLLPDPLFKQVQEWLAKKGFECWLLDLTTDLGIPVYAACAARVDTAQPHLLIGLGAHFRASIAAARAFGEVFQKYAAYASGEVLGFARMEGLPPASRAWWQARREDLLPCVFPNDDVKRRPFDFNVESDILSEWKMCHQIAEQHGLHPAVVDLSRPGLALRVLRVIVPELCPRARRLAAPRLREVPVRMGWRAEAVEEAAINRYPLFP